MRLLHYWSTKVYKEMNVDPARWPVWQMDCVEIGFDFPFLLRGLLALAAVHKVATDPKAERQKLLLQADTHMSSALDTYRKNLGQPRDETAMPMFLLSVVIVTYNLASALLEAPEDPIGALQHCFHLVQGVSLVIQPHMDQIINSKMMNAIVEQGPGSMFDGEVPEVLRLKSLAATKKTSTGEFYVAAIDSLHEHFLKTRQCPPQNDRLVCISPSFCPLILTNVMM